MADELSKSQFAADFNEFVRQMSEQGESVEDPILPRIQAFIPNPASLAVISETFEPHDLPNVDAAVRHLLAAPDCQAEVLGVAVRHKEYTGASLAQLVLPETKAGIGPVEYHNIDLPGDETIACVCSGLYLLQRGAERFLLLIDQRRTDGPEKRVRVEVMAADPARSTELIADIRKFARKHNIYRSRVISLTVDWHDQVTLQFQHLEQVARDRIILPAGVLDRITRHAIGFARRADVLRAARRHLKRGMLLFGPPGTGKTLVAMHIATSMPDRTTILVTGADQALLRNCCRIARLLAPATIVIEDVDLIAEDRETSGACVSPLLMELLNQMDGLQEDADILFLLTTNRPKSLEGALASRPGRVDLAIEIPLPDADCRGRLVDLYQDGLEGAFDRERVVQQTAGASAALFRELFRKAALFAAEEDETAPLRVTDEHIDAAMEDLVFAAGPLSRSLLGFHAPPGN